MPFLPFSLLSLAAAIVFAPAALASSSARNPISALSTVQNATIHANQHRITALSDFELTFDVRDDLHVRFTLEPNHDILAEDASISYLAPDGTITHQEPLDRLEHKVFRGTAWVQRPRGGIEEWQRAGWARVMVRRDGKRPFFEGAFAVNHDHHHIQSSRNYLQTRHPLDPSIEEFADGEEYMVMWRDSDIVKGSVSLPVHAELKRGYASLEDMACQADGLKFNRDRGNLVYMGTTSAPAKRDVGALDFSNMFRRQIDSTTGGSSAGVDLKQTIGQNAGCPTTRKVALVGVATDCTYAQEFNSTQSLRENVISQMNQASEAWEDGMNISLGLQNLTVSTATCPSTPAQDTEWNQACSDSVDIQDRLNYFSAWRGSLGGDNSHWTLLTTCNTGSAIGLAWLGQACINTAYTTNVSMTGNGATSGEQSETVSGANVVVRSPAANEWEIIAHETGHTFGAVHDCYAQTCSETQYVNSQQCCPLSSSVCNADERYIMNPFAVEGVSKFSPCTIGNICSAIGRNSVKTTCLSNNQAVKTISGQQCGNGIVEPGEQCDCGGVEGCGDDPCCDGATCKFKNGAVCDDANDDCCTNCQMAANGTVCRAGNGVCNPQEVCSGTAPNCPPDETAPNGQSCGNGLQCASGQCTSRDQQCKTVMGSYTQTNNTYACDSTGCTISCASPQFGTGVCYGLQQYFLDGTDCGGGGECQNGQCQGSSFGGEVKSWIDQHKAVVIGVASAVGAIVLLMFLCCLRRCFIRRKVRRQPKLAPSPPPGGWQGWNGARAPPPPTEQGGWYPPPPMQQYPKPQQDPTLMSGARGLRNPASPPPAYAGGRTVRYA